MKLNVNSIGRDGTPCRPGFKNSGTSGRRRRGVPTLILATLLALAFTFGCGNKRAAHFGEPFSEVPEAALSELLESPDDFYRRPVRVKGTIDRQCPAAGCWLFLKDAEGNSIRVELGDYFPKLPVHVGGTAEVEGEWIRKGDRHEFIGTRITFSETEATP